jgi:hypothetical protein
MHDVLIIPGGGGVFHQRRARPICAMWSRICWRASWSGGNRGGSCRGSWIPSRRAGTTGRFWRHEEKSTAKIASSPAASESGGAQQKRGGAWPSTGRTPPGGSRGWHGPRRHEPWPRNGRGGPWGERIEDFWMAAPTKGADRAVPVPDGEGVLDLCWRLSVTGELGRTGGGERWSPTRRHQP